jgi:hypothetical protein
VKDKNAELAHEDMIVTGDRNAAIILKRRKNADEVKQRKNMRHLSRRKKFGKGTKEITFVQKNGTRRNAVFLFVINTGRNETGLCAEEKGIGFNSEGKEFRIDI